MTHFEIETQGLGSYNKLVVKVRLTQVHLVFVSLKF